jgi:hypothetical protein
MVCPEACGGQDRAEVAICRRPTGGEGADGGGLGTEFSRGAPAPGRSWAS